MLFQKQVKAYLSVVIALLVLVVFCVNIRGEQLMGLGPDVNLFELGKSAEGKAYITIAASAKRAYMMNLTDPSNTEALEKLVVMSNDFITTYPTSEWIPEIYFYLGKVLVQLGRVEAGIATLEKMLSDTPPNHAVVTRYHDYTLDAIKWYPFEYGLLELGFAYEKLKKHDKADAVYEKLITHPEFAGGKFSEIARQILEIDIALRTGNVPEFHKVWIGRTAPNFRMENRQLKEPALHQYSGKVVLLYYGETNMQVLLDLMKIHNKYENQNFQIITANADVSEAVVSKPILKNGAAWVHYHDRFGKIVDMFHLRSLPAIFLIDSEGIVRKTQANGETLEKAIDELVTENNLTYADPRSQEIITAAFKAHGGLEKLQRVENFVYNYHSIGYLADGSIDSEVNGKSYSNCDKYRSENQTNTGKQSIQIFDGKAVYTKTGEDAYKRLSPEHTEYLIELYKDNVFNEPMWLLTSLAKSTILIQYVGKENVEGTPASVIRVRQPSGTPIKVYFSEKTDYIIQYVVEQGPVNKVISLKQYKDVDGIRYPHHWVEKQYYHIETSFTNVSFNAVIDPKLFNPKE